MNKKSLLIITAFTVGIAFWSITRSTASVEETAKKDNKVSSLKNKGSYSGTSDQFNDRNTAGSENSSESVRRINVQSTGSSKGLTFDEIQVLGENFKNEKDKERRRQFFDELIAGMTAENALEIRKFIEKFSDRSSEWREFHKAYGAVAGQIGVLHGEETKGRDVELTLAGWTAADPASALDWYFNLNESDKKSMMSQDRLAFAMLDGLAENDLNYATEFMLNLDTKGGAGWRASNVMGDKVWEKAIESGDVAFALNWSDNLPDGDLKNLSQAQLARKYAGLDPVLAAAWVESLAKDSKINNYAVKMVADQWRRKDPAAAVTWLATFDSTQNDLRGSYYSTFSSWASKDLNAATEFLDSLSDSRNKDYAISGITRTLSSKNPQQALDIATSIKDSNLRVRSLIDSSRRAFRDNPEKLVDWLTKSELSSADQEKVLSGFTGKRKR